MSKPIYLFSISSHPKAKHINPLSITFFQPKVDFSKYDSFIITSKQISKILSFYEINNEELKPALCISKQSAKSYKVIGGDVLETAEGYGDTLVKYIEKYPKSTKWLYLRAETVASDFVRLCHDKGYSIDEEILYQSNCSENMINLKIEKNAVLIFTSPSSVECFLKYNNFEPEHKLVVIGKTTLKKIPKGVEVNLSKQKSIESCVEIAKTL